MQPTYLPWMGYFALVDLVDVFVFLDDVQFDRRSWQQRNRIKGPNGEILLTVPVRKASRDTLLNHIKINYDQAFPNSHITNIERNYGKSQYVDDYWGPIQSVLESGIGGLAALNICLIETLTRQLELDVQFIRSSELSAQGRKDQYLAEICVELDATMYLSAEGSRSYLEDSSYFEAREIRVDFLDFSHPTYAQKFGPFSSHLSMIDLLLNTGPKAGEILRSGY